MTPLRCNLMLLWANLEAILRLRYTHSVSFALRVGMARRDLCRPEYKIRDVMLIRSWVFVVNICITETVATDDGNALRGAFINLLNGTLERAFQWLQ